jgi:hypothetical protein
MTITLSSRAKWILGFFVIMAIFSMGAQSTSTKTDTAPEITPVVEATTDTEKASCGSLAPTAQVLMPDDANPITTPIVGVDDYLIPEESPDGASPLPHDMWLDNSPLYEDGWLLFVNDSNDTIKWVNMAPHMTDKQLGA